LPRGIHPAVRVGVSYDQSQLRSPRVPRKRLPPDKLTGEKRTTYLSAVEAEAIAEIAETDQVTVAKEIRLAVKGYIAGKRGKRS
jgi:hypothetical protein